MVPPSQDPTPAEWKVLRILWEAGPSSSREIATALENSEGWSSSTVKTLLRRLVEKRHLRTKRVGNSFLYSASRSPLRSLRSAGEELLARASGGTVGPLLAHLVRKSRLSDDEVATLRALLDEKDGESSGRSR